MTFAVALVGSGSWTRRQEDAVIFDPAMFILPTFLFAVPAALGMFSTLRRFDVGVFCLALGAWTISMMVVGPIAVWGLGELIRPSS